MEFEWVTRHVRWIGRGRHRIRRHGNCWSHCYVAEMDKMPVYSSISNLCRRRVKKRRDFIRVSDVVNILSYLFVPIPSITLLMLVVAWWKVVWSILPEGRCLWLRIKLTSEDKLDLCRAEGSSRLKTLAGENWFELVSAPNVANRSESDSSETKREAAVSTPFMSKLSKGVLWLCHAWHVTAAERVALNIDPVMVSNLLRWLYVRQQFFSMKNRIRI